MKLSLIVLAAGKGSRFGGNKQLAEVGPTGQSLFEYSVYDACQAGFDHVVFVVSESQDTAEFSNRLASFAGRLQIDFVRQKTGVNARNELIDTASPRLKPWGTAHAVLQCQICIDNPFAVINADDFYGRSNFLKMAQFLQENRSNSQACAMPGYKLDNTLSTTGGVNRGFCSVTEDGYLQSILEVRNIQADDTGCISSDSEKFPTSIQSNTIVSMNFWGFHQDLLSVFEEVFESFLEENAHSADAELYIPSVVDPAIKSGRSKVRVFPTEEKWQGVTYVEDVAEVRSYLKSLTTAGVYPEVRAVEFG